jgi:hypothetical protein
MSSVQKPLPSGHELKAPKKNLGASEQATTSSMPSDLSAPSINDYFRGENPGLLKDLRACEDPTMILTFECISKRTNKLPDGLSRDELMATLNQEGDPTGAGLVKVHDSTFQFSKIAGKFALHAPQLNKAKRVINFVIENWGGKLSANASFAKFLDQQLRNIFRADNENAKTDFERFINQHYQTTLKAYLEFVQQAPRSPRENHQQTLFQKTEQALITVIDNLASTKVQAVFRRHVVTKIIGDLSTQEGISIAKQEKRVDQFKKKHGLGKSSTQSPVLPTEFQAAVDESHALDEEGSTHSEDRALLNASTSPSSQEKSSSKIKRSASAPILQKPRQTLSPSYSDPQLHRRDQSPLPNPSFPLDDAATFMSMSKLEPPPEAPSIEEQIETHLASLTANEAQSVAGQTIGLGIHHIVKQKRFPDGVDEKSAPLTARKALPFLGTSVLSQLTALNLDDFQEPTVPNALRALKDILHAHTDLEPTCGPRITQFLRQCYEAATPLVGTGLHQEVSGTSLDVSTTNYDSEALPRASSPTPSAVNSLKLDEEQQYEQPDVSHSSFVFPPSSSAHLEQVNSVEEAAEEQQLEPSAWRQAFEHLFEDLTVEELGLIELHVAQNYERDQHAANLEQVFKALTTHASRKQEDIEHLRQQMTQQTEKKTNETRLAIAELHYLGKIRQVLIASAQNMQSDLVQNFLKHLPPSPATLEEQLVTVIQAQTSGDAAALRGQANLLFSDSQVSQKFRAPVLTAFHELKEAVKKHQLDEVQQALKQQTAHLAKHPGLPAIGELLPAKPREGSQEQDWILDDNFDPDNLNQVLEETDFSDQEMPEEHESHPLPTLKAIKDLLASLPPELRDQVLQSDEGRQIHNFLCKCQYAYNLKVEKINCREDCKFFAKAKGIAELAEFIPDESNQNGLQLNFDQPNLELVLANMTIPKEAENEAPIINHLRKLQAEIRLMKITFSKLTNLNTEDEEPFPPLPLLLDQDDAKMVHAFLSNCQYAAEVGREDEVHEDDTDDENQFFEFMPHGTSTKDSKTMHSAPFSRDLPPVHHPHQTSANQAWGSASFDSLGKEPSSAELRKNDLIKKLQKNKQQFSQNTESLDQHLCDEIKEVLELPDLQETDWLEIVNAVLYMLFEPLQIQTIATVSLSNDKEQLKARKNLVLARLRQEQGSLSPKDYSQQLKNLFEYGTPTRPNFRPNTGGWKV